MAGEASGVVADRGGSGVRREPDEAGRRARAIRELDRAAGARDQQQAGRFRIRAARMTTWEARGARGRARSGPHTRQSEAPRLGRGAPRLRERSVCRQQARA